MFRHPKPRHRRRVAKRINKMPRPEFEAIRQRNWSPVKLEGEAIPQWMEGLPSTLVHSVYASGSPILGLSYSDSHVASADLTSSMEVYRYSPDDPVALNRGCYPVITFASSDSDHWLDKIPERLRGAEVLGFHQDTPMFLKVADCLDGASRTPNNSGGRVRNGW